MNKMANDILQGELPAHMSGILSGLALINAKPGDYDQELYVKSPIVLTTLIQIGFERSYVAEYAKRVIVEMTESGIPEKFPTEWVVFTRIVNAI
jgi:hypothetical protein